MYVYVYVKEISLRKNETRTFTCLVLIIWTHRESQRMKFLLIKDSKRRRRRRRSLHPVEGMHSAGRHLGLASLSQYVRLIEPWLPHHCNRSSATRPCSWPSLRRTSLPLSCGHEFGGPEFGTETFLRCNIADSSSSDGLFASSPLTDIGVRQTRQARPSVFLLCMLTDNQNAFTPKVRNSKHMWSPVSSEVAFPPVIALDPVRTTS